MASRARVLSYSVWSLAFLCLLVPIVLTAEQNNPNPPKLRPEERLIIVWKVLVLYRKRADCTKFRSSRYSARRAFDTATWTKPPVFAADASDYGF